MHKCPSKGIVSSDTQILKGTTVLLGPKCT